MVTHGVQGKNSRQAFAATKIKERWKWHED
jgi:hypothetical protein